MKIWKESCRIRKEMNDRLISSRHQRGAVKEKVCGKLLPVCGSCLWWISQLSGGWGLGSTRSAFEKKS